LKNNTRQIGIVNLNKNIVVKLNCINLKRAVNRRKDMEKSWKDFEVTFFDAIDKKYIEEFGDIIPYVEHQIPHHRGFLRTFHIAGRACATSHYFLLKQCLETDEDWFFIMEDDVKCNTSPELLREQFLNMKNEYPCVEVFILHGKSGPCKIHKRGKYSSLVECGHVWGCIFYVISRNGAEELIKYIETMELPVDLYWKNFIKDSKIAICNHTHGIHIGKDSYINANTKGTFFP